jgi:hypothetical protein
MKPPAQYHGAVMPSPSGSATFFYPIEDPDYFGTAELIPFCL